MAEILELEQNGFGYRLDFICTYSDDSRVDLTGMNPWIIMGDIVAGTTHYSGQCTLGTYPVSGECYITVPTGMTDTVGLYKCEIEVMAAGQRIDVNRFTLSIVPTLTGHGNY